MQVHSGRGRLAGLASAVAITVLLAGGSLVRIGGR